MLHDGSCLSGGKLPSAASVLQKAFIIGRRSTSSSIKMALEARRACVCALVISMQYPLGDDSFYGCQIIHLTKGVGLVCP